MQPKKSSSRFGKGKQFLKLLGPGLISGAADDDPSGIATYSQVGAHYGFAMLWIMLITFPLMSGIQEISARMGRVTGKGIAGNMRIYYSPWITVPVIGLLLSANLFNLGADIMAMGEAMSLLAGGSSLLYAGLLSGVSLFLQIVVPYSKYVSVLRWLTLSLFAYVGVALAVHIPWRLVLYGSIIPVVTFNVGYLSSLVAVLGTTISPYLFFWQASLETEEIKAERNKPLNQVPQQGPQQLRRIKYDTLIGMAVSNVIAYFIMLTTGATLHVNGKTHVDTAAQAAEALRPIAGPFAYALFGAGIIGTGMLALPVLAGSIGYSISELFRWPVGLNKELCKAKHFYAIISGAMLLGFVMDFIGLNPLAALFWSAVMNGIVAAPIMVFIMIMSQNRKIMENFTPNPSLRINGWIATTIMGAGAVGLLLTAGR